MYICNGWMTYVDTTPITLIYDAMTSRLRIPCHHCDHQNPRVWRTKHGDFNNYEGPASVW